MKTAGPMLRSKASATAQPSVLVVHDVPAVIPAVTEMSLQSMGAAKAQPSAPDACKSLLIPRIAIDCGNVISITDTGSCNNLAQVVDASPSDDCVRAIRSIVTTFGPNNVFVLSKCKRAMQQAVTVMFGRTCFFERTGLLPSNVLFCTQRSGGNPPSEAEMRAAGRAPQGLRALLGPCALLCAWATLCTWKCGEGCPSNDIQLDFLD